MKGGWSYFGTTWFLPIIMLCYIVYFIMAKLRKDKKTFLFSQIIVALLSLSLLSYEIEVSIFNSLVFRGLSCFAIGTILAYLYTKREKYYNKKVAYVFLIILFIVYVTWRFWGDSAIGDMQLLFIIALAPMIIWVCLFVPFIVKILSSKLFVFLGSISMGIYLWHFPIQCMIKLFDQLLGLNIKYEASMFSFVYMFLVILFASLYKILLQGKEKWLFGGGE